MLIGREKELKELNRSYDKFGFHCALIYGRPRLGKHAFIWEFTAGKKYIWLRFSEVNEKMLLSLLTRSILEQVLILDEFEITSWENLFDLLAELSYTEKCVVIFEEFQNAAFVNENFIPLLETYMKKRFADTNMYLILKSSDVSFVKNILSSANSKRYRTNIEFKELDYQEAYAFLKPFSYEDALLLYSCIGGSPYYLSKVDDSLSAWENLERFFFKDKGRLYENPSQTSMRELREQTLYNSILYAVAAGNERFNDIYSVVGEEQRKLNKYIKMLRSFSILERITPYGDDPETGRKGIYVFAENGCRFWFRFVLDDKTIDQVGIDDPFFEKPFEQICMQYLKAQNRRHKLPFTAAEFGRWWGSTSSKNDQPEIDIIAADESGKKAILCECKWSGSPVTVDEVKALIEKKSLISDIEDAHYMFFSRSGFAPDAVRYVKYNQKVELLGLNDLFDF